MARNKKTSAADPWDSGELGRDEAYVGVVGESEEAAIDEALGLKLISIRLPVKLIEDLKYVAAHHGIGYQPLIRDLLSRFAVSEMAVVLKEQLQKVEQRHAKQKKIPVKYELPAHDSRRKRAA